MFLLKATAALPKPVTMLLFPATLLHRVAAVSQLFMLAASDEPFLASLHPNPKAHGNSLLGLSFYFDQRGRPHNSYAGQHNEQQQAGLQTGPHKCMYAAWLFCFSPTRRRWNLSTTWGTPLGSKPRTVATTARG